MAQSAILENMVNILTRNYRRIVLCAYGFAIWRTDDRRAKGAIVYTLLSSRLPWCLPACAACLCRLLMSRDRGCLHRAACLCRVLGVTCEMHMPLTATQSACESLWLLPAYLSADIKKQPLEAACGCVIVKGTRCYSLIGTCPFNDWLCAPYCNKVL